MHPTRIRSTPPFGQAVAHTEAPAIVFRSGANRLLLPALLATLALVLSGPAAADKRHDHRHGYGQHSHQHHGHPVHKQYLQHSKGPQHHSKHDDRHHRTHRGKKHNQHPSQHPNKHYVIHHHSAPQRHAPAPGFRVNIWGIAPLLSGHNHNAGASFHYHGQQRCYHRH